MIRISNVDSFKTLGDFIKVLDKAKAVEAETGQKRVEKKRFGGYTVSLKVNVQGVERTIHVSRNQLAKLALKLAKNNPEAFNTLKDKLIELDAEGTGGGRVTRLKQKVGNTLFKIRHGAERATLLKNKAEELDPDAPFGGSEKERKAELKRMEANLGEGAKNAAKELKRREKEVESQLKKTK